MSLIDECVHSNPYVLPWAVLLLAYFIWDFSTIYFLKKKFPAECEFLNLRFKKVKKRHLFVLVALPLLVCGCLGAQEFPNNFIFGASVLICIFGSINFLAGIIFILRNKSISYYSIKLRYIIVQAAVIFMMFLSLVMIEYHMPENPYITDLNNVIQWLFG